MEEAESFYSLVFIEMREIHSYGYRNRGMNINSH